MSLLTAENLNNVAKKLALTGTQREQLLALMREYTSEPAAISAAAATRA